MPGNFIKKHPVTSHFLIILQLAGMALSCYPVGLKNLGNFYWLILCAVGIVLGITTLFYNKIGNFSIYPEPKSHAKLITSGPYRYIRHPMYSSLIIMMLGIALYNFHWLNGVGFILVSISVINKANLEERLLIKHFQNYAEYQRNTHKFFPNLY